MKSIGATPLYIASQKGKKEVVELLIRKGSSNRFSKTIDGCTCHCAQQVIMVIRKLVELLITKGAAIDLAL